MPIPPIHPAHRTKNTIPDKTTAATAVETASEVAYRGARTLMADPENFAEGREPEVGKKP